MDGKETIRLGCIANVSVGAEIAPGTLSIEGAGPITSPNDHEAVVETFWRDTGFAQEMPVKRVAQEDRRGIDILVEAAPVLLQAQRRLRLSPLSVVSAALMDMSPRPLAPQQIPAL